MTDILLRAQAKVIKFSENGASENVVELTASEFNELMTEIIRLRALLEGIGDGSNFSAKHLRRIARDGILPDEA